MQTLCCFDNIMTAVVTEVSSFVGSAIAFSLLSQYAVRRTFNFYDDLYELHHFVYGSL